MPEMNGDIAQEKIREWEKKSSRPKQRIALLSASSEEEGRKLLESGFDSFIQKPVNKEKILNEIKKSRESKKV